MKTKILTRTAIAAAVLALAAGSAFAAPLGKLRSISATPAAAASEGAGPSWDLATESGALVRVSLVGDDVLRIWAGPKGKLTDAGDKAAAIVVGKPAAQVE